MPVLAKKKKNKRRRRKKRMQSSKLQNKAQRNKSKPISGHTCPPLASMLTHIVLVGREEFSRHDLHSPV
jgi:hypothetical protein